MVNFSPDKNASEKKESSFVKGQKITVEHKDGSVSEHQVINVLDSAKIASIIGINHQIKNPVPVLILDKMIPGGTAQYHPELGVIFAYDNTKPEVMHHEIIHSLEMPKTIPNDLEVFYAKVLNEIPDTSNLQPNFHKNIHEFVADAYSKPGFINNLKEHGLYQEFELLTKYIFE